MWVFAVFTEMTSASAIWSFDRLSLLLLHFVAGPLLRSSFDDVAAYLPDTAAVDPGTGLAATLGWATAAFAAATAAFQLRDA